MFIVPQTPPFCQEICAPRACLREKRLRSREKYCTMGEKTTTTEVLL